VGYFVNAWFNDPHNWSFEKLDRYAQDVRSRNEFDNAIVYYDIMIDKYAQNPIRVAHALNQKAYMLLGKKDIKPARALFQQVVDQFPDQDSAIIVAEIGVADTYRDEKKYDKAVELYEAFAKKWADFPQSVDAYDRIAKIYAADGKVDKALEVYDQIINRYASDAGTILRAEFDKANLMKTQGEYKAASAMFESIVKNYVDVPNTAARAMVGIIECKLLLDEIEEAKALLQKLRYDYPDQNEAAMDAEIYVANAEAQTGDAAEAEARYKKLMETSSDSLQALWAGSRLAALYATVGRNDEALATYETLIERYKDEPEQRNQLRIERAQLLVQMNRYDDAVAALTALAEEAENNEQRQAAALILGQTYMAMRAFDQAIATYEGLRAESPDDKGIEVKVLLGTGAINREQGKYDEAIAKFRRAIEMSDDSAVVFEAYFQIEAAYRDSGQLEKEQAVLEETAKRFANDPTRLSQVRLALAEVMRKRGQFDEAEKILETVARDDDAARAVSALNALVRLHMETGNEEKAAEITAQIQERFPNNTTAQLDAKMDRAAGFMAEGREDEAVALYQQVADSGDGRRRQSALTALMNYNVEKKDFDQVDKIYQTLLDEYGQDPNAEFSAKLTMAGALRTRNRHDEAAKIYEELLKKAPDQHAAASVLDGMAGVDIERKDYDGAREKLQKILTDYSDDQFADERYRARLSLAAVNEMQLDYKAAAQEYDKAIELAQNEEAEAQARASRVRVTAELGQLDQANQFADALAKDFPDKKELHAQVDGYIAQALASRGRVDEAVQRYDNVAANASTDEAKAYALAQVVQIQAGAGQVREAQERFNNLKRSFPDQAKYLEDAHFA
ncbi:tetratricopeptide repeat protein, partial [bacterium]|nr:tetratricopeptide repeat protein [bacterium]